jgi:hypothetical protein
LTVPWFRRLRTAPAFLGGRPTAFRANLVDAGAQTGSLLLDRRVKALFEINAPGVDVGETTARVERRLLDMGLEPAEVRRLESLNFAPTPSAGELGFHPGAALELFERPASTPDFSSRKYRWLRGPLGWLARRLYAGLIRLTERLSQNKNQAFHLAMQELIALNLRVTRLREELNALVRENLSLRAAAVRASHSDATTQFEGDPGMSRSSDLPAIRVLDDRLVRELQGLVDGPIVLFDYAPAGLLQQSSPGRPLLRCGPLAGAPGPAGALADFAVMPENSIAAALLLDAGRFCDRLELLPALAATRLKSGGMLYLRFDSGASGSPFRRASVYTADEAALEQALSELGLRKLRLAHPEGLAAGSLEALFQKS